MIDNLNGNKIVCRNTFHHYKNTHPVTYGDGEKENGTYGLDYDGILAIAVKAIQELEARIKDLEAK